MDRPTKFIPTLDGERIVEAYDRVPQDRVYMVFPTSEYWSPDEPRLDLASAILTDGLSSRLQKVLVYDKQLASDVSSFNIAFEIAGAFVAAYRAR